MSTMALPKLSTYVVLGSSESLKGMVSTFPFAVITGLFSKVGEKIRLLATSFRSISSSKVSLISLDRKFTEESGGSDFKSNGGRVSLGPPAGGMMFAHPVGTDDQKAATRIKTSAVKR